MANYFDNIVQASLFNTYLAWGIIGLLAFLLLLTAAYYFRNGDIYNDDKKKTRLAVTVFFWISMLYVFLSFTWWFGLYANAVEVDV